MRFNGEIKIPEVDHPGIPVTFAIDDGRAEVLLDEESLGRWSLYDVHASRLVASVFSVKLGDEEITFLANDPIDFAYRGVEHMAESWARYKTMTLPRRMMAVAKSRRGSTPSRLEELKEAMLANLGGGVPAAAPAWSDVTPPVVEETIPVEPVSPGLHVTEGRSVDPIVSKPPVVEEDIPGEPVLPGLHVAESRSVEPIVSEPPVVEEDIPAEPVPPSPPASRPRILPGPGLLRRASAPEPEPVSMTEPEPVAEPEPEPVAASNGHVPPGLVVDLGPLEFEHEPPTEEPETPVVEVAPDQLASVLEPALAGVAGEKSGLFSAVRSAFVRNRALPHQHEFVDAPGGIGITRHICRECGHVSIGVKD